MKSNKLKSFFNKYIKANLKREWEIKNHLFYTKVESSILKGIYFNSSGFSEAQFEPMAFILPLYLPKNIISFNYGKNLRTPTQRQWWEYDESRLEQLGSELVFVINLIEDDFLSKINNAESFYQYYKKDKKASFRNFEAIAYSASAAYAGLKNAKEELNDLMVFLKKKEDLNNEWVNEVYKNTEKLLNGDMSAIFQEWESQNRITLKI